MTADLLLRKKQLVEGYIKRNVLVTKELLHAIDSQLADELRGEESYPVKVVFSYSAESKKRTTADFVSYFNARYRALERLLQGRHELQNLTSIGRLAPQREPEQILLI